MEKDQHDSHVEEWRPHTPPVTELTFKEVVSRARNVAIHFWAVWDRADQEQDDVIRQISPRLDGWVEFYSCDIDDQANHQLCENLHIVSIPCVLVFVEGELRRRMIGLRDEQPLVREILCALTDERACNKPWWRFW